MLSLGQTVPACYFFKQTLNVVFGVCAGYLPGMMLPHIKFFGAMSLLYIALGVVWAGLYARYWTEVFTLQHCISAVLALGMMEMSTWYASTLSV